MYLKMQNGKKCRRENNNIFYEHFQMNSAGIQFQLHLEKARLFNTDIHFFIPSKNRLAFFGKSTSMNDHN
jgi:hypothetical protein